MMGFYDLQRLAVDFFKTRVSTSDYRHNPTHIWTTPSQVLTSTSHFYIRLVSEWWVLLCLSSVYIGFPSVIVIHWNRCKAGSACVLLRRTTDLNYYPGEWSESNVDFQEFQISRFSKIFQEYQIHNTNIWLLYIVYHHAHNLYS